MSITVLDSAGVTQTVETLPVKGRAADVASLPMALSNEDVTLLNSFISGIGGPTDAAWNGVAASASAVAVLKALLLDTAPVVATSSIVTADVTPAIGAVAHATGSCLGPVMQFTGMPPSGLIEQAQVSLASGSYTGSVDLLLFKAALTTSTTTDATAVAITAADLVNLIGVVHLTDLTSLGGAVTLLEAQGIGQPFVLSVGAIIYGVAVVRGSLTPVGTSDALFKLRVVK